MRMPAPRGQADEDAVAHLQDGLGRSCGRRAVSVVLAHGCPLRATDPDGRAGLDQAERPSGREVRPRR